jgi:hypothetical protein
MTTYHTPRATDGVPAPHDYELEQRPHIVAVSPVITIVVDDPALTLDEYIRHRVLTGHPINDDHAAFHGFLRGLARHRYSMTAWDVWWAKFEQWKEGNRT